MCLFHKGKEMNRHINALELIEKNNLSNLRKKIKILLIDDEKIRFIQGVLSIYGDYSADELERMTHNELPWIEARTAQVMDAVISDAAIQKYYSEQVIIKDKIMSFM